MQMAIYLKEKEQLALLTPLYIAYIYMLISAACLSMNTCVCTRDHFCSIVEYIHTYIIQTSGEKPKLLLLHQP